MIATISFTIADKNASAINGFQDGTELISAIVVAVITAYEGESSPMIPVIAELFHYCDRSDYMEAGLHLALIPCGTACCNEQLLCLDLTLASSVMTDC